MNDCQANPQLPLNDRYHKGIFTLSLILVSLTTTGTAAHGLTDVVAQSPTPTTPPAAATSDRTTRPTLKLGNQGEAVTELQALLKLLGFYSGSVTGQFEETTQAAVQRFQAVAGLTADGIVGADTWSKLFPTVPNQATPPTATTTPNAPAAPASSSRPPASTSSPSSPPSSGNQTPAPSKPTSTAVTLPVLRSGMTGEAVTRLQERLKTLGFYKGPVDGAFGTQTEQAVKLAQRHYNLEPDGVVGPATWAAILR